jgi:hypothetical protein
VVQGPGRKDEVVQGSARATPVWDSYIKDCWLRSQTGNSENKNLPVTFEKIYYYFRLKMLLQFRFSKLCVSSSLFAHIELLIRFFVLCTILVSCLFTVGMPHKTTINCRLCTGQTLFFSAVEKCISLQHLTIFFRKRCTHITHFL